VGWVCGMGSDGGWRQRRVDGGFRGQYSKISGSRFHRTAGLLARGLSAGVLGALSSRSRGAAGGGDEWFEGRERAGHGRRSGYRGSAEIVKGLFRRHFVRQCGELNVI
jgi:hypothetical protein